LAGFVTLGSRAALGAAFGLASLGTASFGATLLVQLGLSTLYSGLMSDW